MTQEPGSWPPGSAAEPAPSRPPQQEQSEPPHPYRAQPYSGQPHSAQPHSAQPHPAQPYSTQARPAPASGLQSPAFAPPQFSGPVTGPPAAPWTVAPTPDEGQWRPGRVDPVPGTDFGVVQLQIAPLTSGLAVGALMAGIAAVLVSLLVLCFGLVGSAEGWGAWVAGAFTVLGGLAGGAGVGLGMAGLRQIRRSGPAGRIQFTGRGIAIAGIACGATGLGISVLSFGLSLLLQLR